MKKPKNRKRIKKAELKPAERGLVLGHLNTVLEGLHNQHIHSEKALTRIHSDAAQLIRQTQSIIDLINNYEKRQRSVSRRTNL